MNNRRLMCVLVCACLTMASMAGHTAGETSPEDHFESLSAFLRKTMTKHAVPGAALGVHYQGSGLTEGFGVTNADHPLTVDEETLFQVGSITKTMTGTILMQLVDQGKLDLDKPVHSYVPEFSVADQTATETATVRHLLSHMGGWVGDYFKPTGEGADALDRSLQGMADLEQLAPIGTVFSYNNSGFYVASKVIENITGELYEDVFDELIVKQLGLDNTYIRPTDVMTRRFAVGHFVTDGGTRTARPYALNRSAWGAGGAIMPVGDMLRYAAFHLGNGENQRGERVLSADALQEMQKVQAPKLGTDSAIGLTWHIDKVGPLRSLGHGGATVGQIAQLLMVPEQDFAIAMVTNAGSGRQAIREVVAHALELYLDVKAEVPAARSLSTAQLQEYVGTYSRPFANIILTLEDGELRMQQVVKQGFPDNDAPVPDPEPPVSIEFFDADRIRHAPGSWTAEFVRAPDGSIGWLRSGMRIHSRQ